MLNEVIMPFYAARFHSNIGCRDIIVFENYSKSKQNKTKKTTHVHKSLN